MKKNKQNVMVKIAIKLKNKENNLINTNAKVRNVNIMNVMIKIANTII
jgi:hypothetical protein